MKNTVKTIAFGVITFTVVACASQKNQTSNNQRPSGQQSRPQQMGSQGGGPPSFTQLLSEMDTNKDGKLAKSEIKGPLANDFAKVDADSDGFISESEFKNAPGPQRNGRQ